MNITFEVFSAVCKHNKDFEDIECNPICVLMTPALKDGPEPNFYTGTEVLCNEENCPFVKADKVPESTKKEYLIRYKCHNCQSEFTNPVEIGKRASGHGGTCPYCGAVDSTGHQGTSGLPWKHRVLGPYNPLNPRVYQW